MTRYDTVVTGGRIVLPYHERELAADLAIKDGRIAAIAESIGPHEADEQIDASGQAVFPGAVDCHYHLGIFRDLATDARTETASCTVGGVTTVISYFRTGQHYLNKSGPYKEIFPEVLETVSGNAKVDYGFHLAPMTAEHVGEIGWLVSEMGVTSFKYYMFYKGFNLAGSSRDGRGYTMADEYDLGHLFEIMEAAASAAAAERRRISVSLHCEQPELLRIFIERAKRDPAVTGLLEYSAGRPPLTERLSIEEAGVLADATGVSVNFLHLSSELALATAIEVARRYPDADMRREVTLHHFALACQDLEGKGLGGKVNPPIRDRSDNEALVARRRARRRELGGQRPRLLHGVREGRRPVAGPAGLRRHRPALSGADLRGLSQAGPAAVADRRARVGGAFPRLQSFRPQGHDSRRVRR